MDLYQFQRPFRTVKHHIWNRGVIPTILLLISLTAESSDTGDKGVRVISVGGSVTEIIHHLGVSGDLIAIDTSSQYPSTLQHLPKVGYFRSLSAEGVLSLEPTLLVGAKGAGPKAVLNQVKDIGVTVKLFTQEKYDIQSWRSLVTEIGQYFDRTAQSSLLINSTLSQIGQLKKARVYPDNQLNVLSLLSVGQRGPMIAGKNTMPDFLFNMAGFRNLGESVNGYKPINNESLITNKIDMIFVPLHMIKAVGGKQGICNNAVIKLALRNQCNVVFMDGLLLMGMGARIDKALEQVIEAANQVHNQPFTDTAIKNAKSDALKRFNQ
jgi:iron complex transport system substrate-binding protein